MPRKSILNALREDGFFPQSSPPVFPGEIREGEQALIHQQPVKRAQIGWRCEF
jgi:hypothetical protein